MQARTKSLARKKKNTFFFLALACPAIVGGRAGYEGASSPMQATPNSYFYIAELTY